MSQLTQCPTCETAFLVRDEHLSAADGLVRCGSCKAIFNAKDYFITNSEQAKQSELELEAEPETEAQPETEAEPESITVVDLREQTHAEFASNEQVEPPSEANLANQEDSSDALNLALDYESSSEPSEELAFDKTDNYRVKDDQDLFQEQLEKVSLSQSELEKEQAVEQVLKPQEHQSHFLKKLFWVSVSIIILISVLFSLFWIKRMSLAEDDAWRPMVESICNYIDCGIPERRALDKIQIRNRELTNNEASVTINLILLNRARFKQAYPRIQTSFTDLDGNLISTSVILPAEYLRAELVGTQMPIDVPVYIQFDVDVDPQLAFGFEFKFL
jgi:predicted Zn finger-like uncharacterized protein